MSAPLTNVRELLALAAAAGDDGYVPATEQEVDLMRVACHYGCVTIVAGREGRRCVISEMGRAVIGPDEEIAPKFLRVIRSMRRVFDALADVADAEAAYASTSEVAL